MAKSTVAIPFKYEDPDVLERTIRIAAGHPAVARVLAVGFSPDTLGPAKEAAERLGDEAPADVEVIAQRRIGEVRAGKGDGMLTGLEAFLADPDAERLHFYDADIRSFEASWITKAEAALDAGWDVARHYFDRASTDAQITWHVTRDGFALLWPDTMLPDIEQPLGGELALSRGAAERLFAAPAVRAQSDWGIDTALTVTMAAERLSIAEVFVPEGKLHGLYGSLGDLRTMATECFEALRRLRPIEVPPADPALHRVEDAGEPPESITTKAAFDLESTLPLLVGGWKDEERALAAALPDPLPGGFEAMTRFPVWNFMDDAAWRTFLLHALDHYDHDDEAWRSLFFRGWTARTVRHTTANALRGYGPAMAALRATVEAFRVG